MTIEDKRMKQNARQGCIKLLPCIIFRAEPDLYREHKIFQNESYLLSL